VRALARRFVMSAATRAATRLAGRPVKYGLIEVPYGAGAGALFVLICRGFFEGLTLPRPDSLALHLDLFVDGRRIHSRVVEVPSTGFYVLDSGAVPELAALGRREDELKFALLRIRFSAIERRRRVPLYDVQRPFQVEAVWYGEGCVSATHGRYGSEGFVASLAGVTEPLLAPVNGWLTRGSTKPVFRGDHAGTIFVPTPAGESTSVVLSTGFEPIRQGVKVGVRNAAGQAVWATTPPIGRFTARAFLLDELIPALADHLGGGGGHLLTDTPIPGFIKHFYVLYRSRTGRRYAIDHPHWDKAGEYKASFPPTALARLAAARLGMTFVYAFWEDTRVTTELVLFNNFLNRDPKRFHVQLRGMDGARLLTAPRLVELGPGGHCRVSVRELLGGAPGERLTGYIEAWEESGHYYYGQVRYVLADGPRVGASVTGGNYTWSYNLDHPEVGHGIKKDVMTQPLFVVVETPEITTRIFVANCSSFPDYDRTVEAPVWWVAPSGRVLGESVVTMKPWEAVLIDPVALFRPAEPPPSVSVMMLKMPVGFYPPAQTLHLHRASGMVGSAHAH
jgi:hypothetical protein